MQHRILIGINTQVGKTMLIFRPALKNECRSEENYNWLVKPAITSNGEHWLSRKAANTNLIVFGLSQSKTNNEETRFMNALVIQYVKT